MKKKRIVVIGGGTGTVSVLSGLKKYEDLDISVIVNMTDDGGSNKVVRDEFGLLPLSDLRKSIIALSNIQNGILRELFTYRFSKGRGLEGHTLGNLIMMGLADITKSETGAIEASRKLFNIKGHIIPVTLDDVKLSVEYDDRTIAIGQHFIDDPPPRNLGKKIKRLFTKPEATATKEAIQAIKNADFIIVGPGDLYTSLLANIVIKGIPQAISKSKAKLICLPNLMTKKGQTDNMKISDFLQEVTKYCKRKPDIVIINNKEISKRILRKYAKYKEYPLEDDLDKNNFRIIRASLISNQPIKKQKGDKLRRSLIRHDATKVGKILYYKVFRNRSLIKRLNIHNFNLSYFKKHQS